MTTAQHTANLRPVLMEIPAKRSYKWVEGYQVDNLQPFMRKREAIAFCKAQGWKYKIGVAVMTTAQHTPEPWAVERVKEGHIYVTSGLPIVCLMDEKRSRKLTEIDKRVHDADRIVSCVNALAGLNPEAIPALVEAAKEAIPDLKHYVSTHGPGPDRRLDALTGALAQIERVS